MPADLTIWHQRRDTLLRIVEHRRASIPSDRRRGAPEPGEDAPPSYTVHIPVGINPGSLGRHNITVEYTLDAPYAFESDHEFKQRESNERAGTYMRVGLNHDNPLGSITRITPEYLANLRFIDPGRPDPKRIRPYLEMERVFKEQPEHRRPAYYEAVLHNVPRGAKLSYRIKVYSQSRVPVSIPTEKDPDTGNVRDAWYSVYTGVPAFEFADVKLCPPTTSVPDVNVIYWKVEPPDGEPAFIHFRFDFADVRRLMSDFSFAAARLDGTDAPANRLTYAWQFDGQHPADQVAEHPASRDWHLPVQPVIQQQFDYVTLSLRPDDLADFAGITWRNSRIADWHEGALRPTALRPLHPVRLMFVHYANQSLNDLFESPNKNYTPPRTYMQTTMRDELGTYSSRPTSNETGIGDGYAYVLKVHAENRLACQFSVNGGFLSMLAQDSPDDIAAIRKQIELGRFEPVISGWAGHRMLYFQEQTNLKAIQYGIDLIEHLLGGTSAVYYPNSRLYAATRNIDGPLTAARINRWLRRSADGNGTALVPDSTEARPLQFVLVDDVGYRKYADSAIRTTATPLWGEYEHCYIWQQQCQVHRGKAKACTPLCSTWYWLFGDGKKMKDSLLSASDAEWQAGKLFGGLRLHFFYGVSQPKLAEKALLIYSDDADKAAGNGWFDGDYNGVERNYAAIFAAAMEWIAAHPWLSVVSAADLDPARECVGTVFVQDAIDPYIHQDPDGSKLSSWREHYPADGDFEGWMAAQIDRLPHELGFEYGRWYREWRSTEAAWLGTTLGELGDGLERALLEPAANQLDELALLGYLNAIHEPHWSKKPLEPFILKADFEANGCRSPAKRAYERPEVLEPEDLALCWSLQARHAHVFRCAARWAELVASGALGPGPEPGPTRRNDGPLIDEIRSMRNAAGPPPISSGVDVGLQWDLDVTENVILYNRRLLVVMDRNGGRITNIFAVDQHGRPIVLSGNVKAYQFLGDDRQYGGQLPCNGIVLQNTVFVANHQYVASDVKQSRARGGTRNNPKTKIKDEPCLEGTVRVEHGTFGAENWLYPDNFNLYDQLDVGQAGDSVGWAYPGLARDVDPAAQEDGAWLSDALVAYRAFATGLGNADFPYPLLGDAPFTKTIQLDGYRIRVSYGGQPNQGHLVANEFSLNLFDMLMLGSKQKRRWHIRQPSESAPSTKLVDVVDAITLHVSEDGPSVVVHGLENCAFSFDTLEGEPNLRLHRAFSDCLEVQSRADGPFSYEIELVDDCAQFWQRQRERRTLRNAAGARVADQVRGPSQLPIGSSIVRWADSIVRWIGSARLGQR